jgi:hypothetical protein
MIDELIAYSSFCVVKEITDGNEADWYHDTSGETKCTHNFDQEK